MRRIKNNSFDPSDIEERYARAAARKKKKMKVSGKSVFVLQKTIRDAAATKKHKAR